MKYLNKKFLSIFFLSFLSIFNLFIYQNCGKMQTAVLDSSMNQKSSLTNSNNQKACLLDGRMIYDGEEYFFHSVKAATKGKDCIKDYGKLRKCRDGVLSLESTSYRFSSCVPDDQSISTNTKKGCVLSGKKLNHSETGVFWNMQSAPCSPASRTCYDGTLAGSSDYVYKTCSGAETTPVDPIPTAGSCTRDAATVKNGDSISLFNQKSFTAEAYGKLNNGCSDSSVQIFSKCKDGVFLGLPPDGDYKYSSCGRECKFGNEFIKYGDKITRYLNSSVPFGQDCKAQNFECKGTDFSDYEFSEKTCSVQGKTDQVQGPFAVVGQIQNMNDDKIIIELPSSVESSVIQNSFYETKVYAGIKYQLMKSGSTVPTFKFESQDDSLNAKLPFNLILSIGGTKLGLNYTLTAQSASTKYLDRIMEIKMSEPSFRHKISPEGVVATQALSLVQPAENENLEKDYAKTRNNTYKKIVAVNFFRNGALFTGVINKITHSEGRVPYIQGQTFELNNASANQHVTFTFDSLGEIEIKISTQNYGSSGTFEIVSDTTKGEIKISKDHFLISRKAYDPYDSNTNRNLKIYKLLTAVTGYKCGDVVQQNPCNSVLRTKNRNISEICSKLGNPADCNLILYQNLPALNISYRVIFTTYQSIDASIKNFCDSLFQNDTGKKSMCPKTLETYLKQ